MSINEASFDFTDNFITVFYGKNGSGKSSILEAIAVCLTEHRRGDSYKDFIQKGCTSATIHLEACIGVDPIVFDVEIVDKKGATPLKRTATFKNQTYTNSECSPLLESFDIDYLQHIMFSMQGENNITDLKPAERSKVLKKIFKFEFIPQVETLTSRITEEQQSLLVFKTRRETLSGKTFDLQTIQPTLSNKEKAELQERSTVLQKEIADIESKEASQKQDQDIYTQFSSQKIALQKSQASCKKEIGDTEVAIEKTDQNINKYVNEVTRLPDIDVYQSRIDVLKKEFDQNVAHLETNKQRQPIVQKAILPIKEEVVTLTHHIAAHEKGECPECGQHTNPASVPDLEVRLVQARGRETVAQAEIDTVRDIISNITIRNSTIESDINSLKKDIASSKKMSSEYTRLISSAEESFKTLGITLKEKKEQYDEYTKQIEEVDRTLSALENKLQDITPSTNLKIEQAQIADKLKNDDVAAGVNKNLEIINKKILEDQNKNTTELASLNELENKASSYISNLKEAKKIIEVDLPNYAIVNACAKLQKHINNLISNMYPGMIVQLYQSRNGIEFFYCPSLQAKDAGDWLPTKMASGAEKEVLSIAWRIALSQAYSLSILMLDEIDSAAHSDTSERMFKEIARLQSFKQLFLITHKDDIPELLRSENDHVTIYHVDKGEFTLI